jgi:uncharacterized protein (TIGR02246 family)
MNTTEAETAVRHTILGTVRAWTANDPTAFAARYSPDATVVLPGTFLQGRAEIEAYMKAGFDGPLRGTRGSDEEVSLRIIGGGAVMVSLSGYLPADEAQTVPARARRATWTLARHGDEWLVEAYHNCDL